MPDSQQQLNGRDIIVIGASAGGLQVLIELARGLSVDVPAALFVTVHTSPDNPGVLPQILGRFTRLPVAFARDREPIARGRIYVAPPDYHLVVKRHMVRVVRGPKENGFRPAVDPLFRTAARSHGPRVIGVVLSGGLDDGTLGLADIVAAGGLAVVQDPQEAMIPSMPLSALRHVEVHRVLKAADMAPALTELVAEGVEETADMAIDDKPDIAETGDSLQRHVPPGAPTPYTCPECGGAVWESADAGLVHFRCHVGHGYTADTLVAGQQERIEVAMWTALRALEENATLRRKMAERTDRAGFAELARRYIADAEAADERASVLRAVLQREPAVGDK